MLSFIMFGQLKRGLLVVFCIGGVGGANDDGISILFCLNYLSRLITFDNLFLYDSSGQLIQLLDL